MAASVAASLAAKIQNRLFSDLMTSSHRYSNTTNHNYNKILESDWFLARPIFYQIGARAAKVSNNKVSNNKVSNNKVRVVRMRALFIWFLVVSFKNGFFAFISDDKSLVGFALSNFFLEFCYSYD